MIQDPIEEILDLSVSEFSRHLKMLIENRPKLQRIAIRGEVSGWKPQQNGNLYFTLKDSNATLACFAFGNDARKFPEVADGVAVRAIGAIGIREMRSEYQLRVTDLELAGIGALAAQVEALREKLRKEGAFDPERKRPVPAFARRVALVTAPGDAMTDFQQRVTRRAPNVEIVFFPTRVQGVNADVEIATALDKASRANVDVIVLTRGGGSYEDRFAFNLEPVARAILRCKLPVIAAIGHDADHHVADDVADLSLATPTAAAEHIAKEWAQVYDRLNRARTMLVRRLRDTIAQSAQRLDASDDKLRHQRDRLVLGGRNRLTQVEQRLDRASPQARVGDQRVRFTQSAGRLDAWLKHAQQRWRHAVERAGRAIDACNPTAPLQRGYAIVTADGHALSDASQAPPGTEIVAQLQRGRLHARVEATEHGDE